MPKVGDVRQFSWGTWTVNYVGPFGRLAIIIVKPTFAPAYSTTITVKEWSEEVYAEEGEEVLVSRLA